MVKVREEEWKKRKKKEASVEHRRSQCLQNLDLGNDNNSPQIFDVAGETVTQLAELAGHEGPVWAVAWAHPRFGGGLLASASFDHRVLLWVESSSSRGGAPSSWQRLPFEPPAHSASVNALAFAPQELGLALAAASSDGSVSVLTAQSSQCSASPPSLGGAASEGWSAVRIERAHAAGVLGLSWVPPSASRERRLATCGCDNLIKLWRFDESSGGWSAEGAPLAAHSEWVRDVAFAPRLTSPSASDSASSSSCSSSSPVLASAGQDGKVFVWSEDRRTGAWTPALVNDFGSGQPVWRVSWSTAGGVLAVSDSRGSVSLWKESVDGQWEQVCAPA